MTKLPDGVHWIPVSSNADARGTLSAFDRHSLPFEPVRTFVITNVPRGATRGGHVLDCDELLWVLNGQCRLAISENDSAKGILIPKGLLLELSDFAPGTVLIVMAPRPFNHRHRAEPDEPSKRPATIIPAADPSRRFAEQDVELNRAISRVFQSGTFILGE